MYSKKIRLKSAICLNGHVLNSDLKLDSFPEYKFCPKCGAEVIDSCPECNSFILGGILFQEKSVSGFIIGRKTGVEDRTVTHYNDKEIIANNELPYYCSKCGKAYPWTINFLKNYDTILEMQSEEIDSNLKDCIYATTENLLKDGFSKDSQHAIMLKLSLNKLSLITKEILIGTISSFGGEAIKTFLFK